MAFTEKQNLSFLQNQQFEFLGSIIIYFSNYEKLLV